jgi:hypothetical protein
MWYCVECGSRDVHAEEWRNINTGEHVCSSEGDSYCGQCETEAFITDDRREAAEARLERIHEERGAA